MGAPPGAPMGSPPGGPPTPAGPPPSPGTSNPAFDGRWNDPAAFAATSPPAIAEERDARGGSSPPAPMPEAQKDTPPPQAPARPLGPGRDPLEVPADAPRAIAGFLVSFEGNELGTAYTVHQGKNVVGRKGAADGLDIEIDHPTTSSRHAVVHASARPGRLKVEDPGSTNGTFVNDQKLAKGSHHELKDGDTLRFGGYAVTVKIV